jgi:hypothetical protein
MVLPTAVLLLPIPLSHAVVLTAVVLTTVAWRASLSPVELGSQ